MEICRSEICTGCAACVNACSLHCIEMQEDLLSCLHPVVDESRCVDCGKCRSVCPNNNSIEFHHGMEVYAAWSKDDKQRFSSASGGVASELYKFYIRNGGVGAGVTIDRLGCRFILVKNYEDIEKVKNSKYVFSNAESIYPQIKKELELKHDVLFIGLPCQVAGLYGFLRKHYSRLTTVDIICHGLAPFEYFKQHIEEIENRKYHIDNICFRDPEFGTDTYTLTFKDTTKHHCYNSGANNGVDAYQLGYHRALIYRENCYTCKYAQGERLGDLTIGDFSGLGRISPIDFPGGNLNCVICNTEKGKALLNSTKGNIVYKERPRGEAFEFEKLLQSPSSPHKFRKKFEDIYIETHSFKQATDICLRNDRIKNIRSNISLFIINNIVRLPIRAYKYIHKKTCRP